MGLARLCEYYGIDMADTVAFGDSMNDIEIVRAAEAAWPWGMRLRRSRRRRTM